MAENYTRRVKAILRDHGCTFVRHGKGDHEIWYSPISDRRFMVDNKIKGRKWANVTLKNAGIQKAFWGTAHPAQHLRLARRKPRFCECSRQRQMPLGSASRSRPSS
jgi:hypothetical protein